MDGEVALSTYSDLLRDPRWQRKRLEVLNFADWHCERCGDGDSTLHVHHKRYVKGRAPWEYDIQELAVLCAACHDCEHELAVQRTEFLSRMDLDGPCGIDDLMALVAGFVDSRGGLDDRRSEITARFRGNSPAAFAWGTMVGNLSWFGVSSDGAVRLATLTDPPSQSDFLDELLALMRKHGVRMLGGDGS